MHNKSNKFKKPIVIAEVGCNHKGDIEIAKKKIQFGKKQVHLLSEDEKNILATYQANYYIITLLYTVLTFMGHF